MNRRILIAACALLSSACASTPRFQDRPIVWNVDDTRDIPEPEENVYRLHLYFANIFLLRRATRAMELHTSRPAKSTNALDEVPNSSWFHNRIGVREMTPEEVAKGPGSGPPQLPFSVIGGKVGGGNPGFIAQDATGRKYIVKFDKRENPGMQTGTDAIVTRIFYAFGYHTPADHVIDFTRDQISIGEKSKIDVHLKGEREMVDSDIDAVLVTAPIQADGTYRALASEFLPGKPKGGFDHEGTRDDDPNDTIPHEHRRELRGLRALAAWMNHTDMKEDNTLDMYVEENGRKFLRHYLVDFGEAFAAHAAEKGRYEDGYEYFWDWTIQPLAAISFGLWKRPWEDIKDTRWPAVGAFESEQFEPELYKSAYPYFPFFEADAADHFWGTKILMKFTRAHLEAAVETGKFTDPEAAKYVVDTLIARQRKVGKAYIEAVTPIDEFTIDQRALCGVDLGVRYGFAAQGLLEVLDEDGKSERTLSVGRDGKVCIPLADKSGYQIFRMRTRRDKSKRPTMQVHAILDGNPRIVGIIRKEQN